MTSREWDAATYHRVAGPQETWGRDVLERLPLRGDETVLDAGCGSGRVTALLAERVPRGRVIGVDASAAMVEQARATLAELGDRATVVHADLTELTLPEPVDAIFSTATFHWIPDQERLFARLFAALRPGGRLVAQCGGQGNLDAVLAIVDEVSAETTFAGAFDGWGRPTRFASAEEAAGTLAGAGFTAVDTWLQPWPVVPDETVDFLRTVILRTHLERLAPARRDAFVARVARRLGEPLILDYVRLNLSALRPEGPGSAGPNGGFLGGPGVRGSGSGSDRGAPRRGKGVGMLDDPSVPPPFGVPAGPSLSTPELLSAYLAGAQAGSSPDAHIEEPVLMARDHLVAVRIDGAVLVRGEVPAAAQSVQQALYGLLEAAGMALLERDSVLAGAAVVELAVPRGFEWDLWACDAQEARAALVHRALNEVADFVDAGHEQAQADVDAVLRQFERDW